MIRVLALVCLLFPTTTLQAQDLPGQAGKDMPLIAHLAGGVLYGWEVAEGESVIGKEGITLGGKSQTKLRLTAPVGDRFRLRFDYTYSGVAQPTLHWETNRPNTWALPGSALGWSEFILNGIRGSWHSSNVWTYTHRALDGSSANNGGIGGGTGPLRQFHILIPAGTTLHLRAADVHATVAPVPSSSALVSALVILALVLASICLLGWLLNRRRAPTTSRPVP